MAVVHVCITARQMPREVYITDGEVRFKGQLDSRIGWERQRGGWAGNANFSCEESGRGGVVGWIVLPACHGGWQEQGRGEYACTANISWERGRSAWTCTANSSWWEGGRGRGLGLYRKLLVVGAAGGCVDEPAADALDEHFVRNLELDDSVELARLL